MTPVPSFPCRRIAVPFLLALACWGAGCSAVPGKQGGGDADIYAAYTVEGAAGSLSARVLTRAAACPAVDLDGRQEAMRVRAPAETVPVRSGGAQPDAKPAAFPLLTCELDIASGVRHARVGQHALALPVQAPRRIVVIGDTGCRLKQSDGQFQSCLDNASWPFAQVARSAAAAKPDLVIHVGDFHYRESPCPAAEAGCAGSPWGYGQDTWSADFFDPARTLLASAPWVFVRGNHETCTRAGQGWFRFLDSGAWGPERSCNDPAHDAQADFSPPYAVPLGGDTQLIVFDSAMSGGKAYPATAPAYRVYAAQLEQVDRLAAQAGHSIFLSHHPVLGLAPGKDGGAKPSGLGLPSVMRGLHPGTLFSPGVELAVHGHVHLFEALSFETGHPATLVAGNSGSLAEGALPAHLENPRLPFDDTLINDFATRTGFGFALLERTGEHWNITEYDQDGVALIGCTLERRTLKCARI